MASDSKRGTATAARARPTPELLQKLRDGKAALRAERVAMPLPEKVRELLELQHIYCSIASLRRPLLDRERPWGVEP
jgi:hypothetical protein